MFIHGKSAALSELFQKNSNPKTFISPGKGMGTSQIYPSVEPESAMIDLEFQLLRGIITVSLVGQEVGGPERVPNMLGLLNDL